MQEKQKAAMYCRVSSREQEETGYSLDAQEKLLQEYADKHDLSVAKTYKVTESASKWQIRKTLGEMLAYAAKSGTQSILVEKIDRLTRSLKDAAIVDDWVHEKDGREVHFVKENFVLNKNTRAHECLVWDMKVAIARFYTNNLSEEVKKGQKEKIAQGWLPSRAKLGYKTIGEKGHKTHELDEKMSPHIRKMFEYYATGQYSLKALVEKMYQEGLRTRAGTKLVKSRVDDILKDPSYCGSIVWNGRVSDGQQTPLVSKELFEQVAIIRTGRKIPSASKRDFTFKKMFVCGECKGTITGEIKNKKQTDGTVHTHVYYHCSHYHSCTQKRYTKEEQIEEQLFDVFAFFESITPEEAERVREHIKKNHAADIIYKETALTALNEQFMRLQRRIDKLYDDNLDGKIDDTRWEQKDKEIRAEQKSVQDQIARLKSQEAKYFELWLDIIALAFNARKVYEKHKDPEARRKLLAHIFLNMTLTDAKLDYDLKETVQKIADRVRQRLDDQNGSKNSEKPSNDSNLFRTTKKPFATMGKGSSRSLSTTMLRNLPLYRTLYHLSGSSSEYAEDVSHGFLAQKKDYAAHSG